MAAPHTDDHIEEHSSFIRTPKQLITLLVLAFIVPIAVIALLARLAAMGSPGQPAVAGPRPVAA